MRSERSMACPWCFVGVRIAHGGDLDSGSTVKIYELVGWLVGWMDGWMANRLRYRGSRRGTSIILQ